MEELVDTRPTFEEVVPGEPGTNIGGVCSVSSEVTAAPEVTGPSQDSTEHDVDRGEVEAGGLPLDQVFEILRNQRRRHVLEVLRSAEEPVLIGDLAEQIAAWENGKRPHEITSSERKRVYVGLYQAHLPKMDGMDVISFNKPRGVIEPGPNIAAFDEYIAPDTGGKSPQWHVYFTGLSALSIGLLLGVLPLRPMLDFPVTEVALVLVVAAFTLCSAGYAWWVRRSDDG